MGLHPSKEDSEGFPRAGTMENLTTSHRELLQLPDSWPSTYTKILILNRKRFHQIWQDYMISFHWSGSRGDKIKGHPGSLPRCWEAWYLQWEERKRRWERGVIASHQALPVRGGFSNVSPRSRHHLNKHRDHVSHLNITRRILHRIIRQECRKLLLIIVRPGLISQSNEETFSHPRVPYWLSVPAGLRERQWAHPTLDFPQQSFPRSFW